MMKIELVLYSLRNLSQNVALLLKYRRISMQLRCSRLLKQLEEEDALDSDPVSTTIQSHTHK